MSINLSAIERFYQAFEDLGAEGIRSLIPPQKISLVDVKKGSSLIQAGDYDHHLYWVWRGIFKISHYWEDGREHIKAFLPEGRFYMAYSSWLQQTPSEFYVEAIEPALVVKLDFVLIDQILDSSIAMNQAWRRYMDQHFLRHEQREMDLLSRNAQERYERFLKDNASVADRLPLHCIARYIGVTDQSLSRLRKLSKVNK